MANISIPTTFAPSTVAKSAEVNANFSEVAGKFNTYAVQTDVAKTITAPQTFGADLLFVDGLYDIGKTGATRPRDGFFSRNLVVGGTITGAVSGAVTGNASTATALQTPRAINGVAFDGSTPITIPVAAGTLTGTTLAPNVVASSLTSVGTLTTLAVAGATTLNGIAYTFPAAQSANQVLTTNGAGTLTWATSTVGISAAKAILYAMLFS